MNLHWRKLVGLGVLVLATLGSAQGDSVVLRNGRNIHGKFAGGTQGVVAFLADGEMQYYKVADILVMTFDKDDEDILQLPKSDSNLQPQKDLPKSAEPAVKAADKPQDGKSGLKSIPAVERARL